MAVTIDEVERLLDEAELRYERHDDESVVLGFDTRHYVDRDGDNHALVVVKLEEDGEYVKVFVPEAYEVPDEHVPAFLVACGFVSARTKLVQFEWWPDGGVTPIVEFPLEDSTLTARQLHRCVRGLVQILSEFHHALDAVARTGRFDADHIEAPELARGVGDVLDLLTTLPPAVLEAALERARGNGTAD